MVLFNYATKELTAKVVYYGPGLCGKTTNLQFIHEKLPIKNKGKMLSLATETDRTLFFDFLPIELGSIRGMKTRIQLYTVPGQVFYNATRRMVLKGADCVVFVADSQEAMLEPNLQSLDNLRENLEANEIDPRQIPMVLQFNKRDLPNALPIEILNEKLNFNNHPFFEAVAFKGIGVEDTLKGATALVFRSLSTKYGEGNTRPGAAAPAPAPAAPPPAPRPAPEPVAAAPAPAPRPVPAPAPRPAPQPAPQRAPAPAYATVPPMADSLEPLELDMDAEPAPDFGLTEDEEPAPSRADPRETLVRGEAEAFELRQRVRAFAPVEEPSLDLQLEELTESEEPAVEDSALEESPIDDLALETEADPFAAPADDEVVAFMPDSDPEPSPPPPRTGHAASPVWTKAPEPLPELEPPPPPPPAPRPVPVAAPPRVVTAPLTVEVRATGGPTEVSIPLQVRVGDDQPPVNVELRLTLDVRVKQ